MPRWCSMSDDFIVFDDRVFLFPSDLQLELDYWAESGQFDEDELHEVT